MSPQAIPLFRIAFRHTFYASEATKEFSLSPTQSTMVLFRRYNLLWRADSSGYTLYYTKEKDTPPSLAYADHLTTFEFILRSEHPYFFNITEVPFEKISSHKFHLHNRRVYTDVEQPFSLAERDSVGDGDLSATNADLHPNNDLGKVEITLGHGPNGQWLPLPVAADTTPPTLCSYFIAFKARKTRWRYYVINRSRLDFERMEVAVIEGTENDAHEMHKDLAFEQGDPQTLPGTNHVAVPFFSKSAFPLWEKPGIRTELRLMKKNDHPDNKNGLIATIELPMPDWHRISSERQEAGLQIFSDMYVYL